VALFKVRYLQQKKCDCFCLRTQAMTSRRPEDRPEAMIVYESCNKGIDGDAEINH
jgi:hypothetical protein